MGAVEQEHVSVKPPAPPGAVAADMRFAVSGQPVSRAPADLRRTEFARLDRLDEAYLDYTGSALYCESHVRWHLERLQEGAFGNPHAAGGASVESSRWIDMARSSVLAFLDADPREYEVVFTTNATAAARLVGESFPFRRRSRMVLTADNHNSVLGLRQFARAAGANVSYVPLDAELRLQDLRLHLPGQAPRDASVLAFPAQSNFSGVRHPLGLVRLAQSLGYMVLLDASAFVPTARLSLSQVPADFAILSLYKVTGYPTGVGALVARHSALERLHRPWFAGGTVEFASAQNGMHVLRSGAGGFEDGTPDFLALVAVPWGLSFMTDAIGGQLTDHVRQLTVALLSGLQDLRHANGRRLVTIHGPTTDTARGGTVAFNLRDASGRWIPHDVVESRAAVRRISLRSGCFCNPGAAEHAFGFDAQLAAACVDKNRLPSDSAFSIQKFARCMGGVPVGAVRASVGLATNARDIARLLDALDEWRR